MCVGVGKKMVGRGLFHSVACEEALLPGRVAAMRGIGHMGSAIVYIVAMREQKNYYKTIINIGKR